MTVEQSDFAGTVLEAALTRFARFKGPAQAHAFHMLRNAWQQREHMHASLRGPLLLLLSVPPWHDSVQDWMTARTS